MKKLLSTLLVLCMVFALAACGSAPAGPAPAPATAPPATDAPQETPDSAPDFSAMSLEELKPYLSLAVDGKLTVGTSPDFPPYEFYKLGEGGEAELAGFDMSLAKAIADALGLELSVVPMDFNGILAELMVGNIDLAIAGFSPDPEREDSCDFSTAYYTGGQSFVIRAADADKYKGFADMEGQPVGSQIGSIQYDLALEHTPKANNIALTKVTDIVAELLTGKLEGAFIETAVAESYIKNYPDLAIGWEVPYDAEGSCVAVHDGDVAWLTAVNLIIDELLTNGQMSAFVAQANEDATGEQVEWTAEGGLAG